MAPADGRSFDPPRDPLVPRAPVLSLRRDGARFDRSATYAWSRRRDLLREDHPSRQVRRFVELARRRAQAHCSVEEAARELKISPRHLTRICVGRLGHPPALILALARVASVAEAILRTDLKLGAIASGHGFPDQSAMNRTFIRFVGVRPGLYRERPPDRDAS